MQKHTLPRHHTDITQPWQLAVLMIAIILLTLQAIAINRLFGMPLPLWSQSPAPVKNDEGADAL